MRQFVLDYYVVLNSILRNKPQVRRLLAWCRHCGIPFITNPCNAGRRDLGCPFGCAELHRLRSSTERSVRYNRSPKGKLKRYQRQEERRLAKERSGASKAAEEHPAATKEEEDGVSPSVEPLPPDRLLDHPCPSPAVPPSGTLQTAGTVGGGPVSSGDCGGLSTREREATGLGYSPPADSERLQLDPGIVGYVQFVISLLEERRVHREEVLEMLVQPSFARQKRIDYVLRRLREEPERPP